MKLKKATSFLFSVSISALLLSSCGTPEAVSSAVGETISSATEGGTSSTETENDEESIAVSSSVESEVVEATTTTTSQVPETTSTTIQTSTIKPVPETTTTNQTTTALSTTSVPEITTTTIQTSTIKPAPETTTTSQTTTTLSTTPKPETTVVTEAPKPSYCEGFDKLWKMKSDEVYSSFITEKFGLTFEELEEAGAGGASMFYSQIDIWRVNGENCVNVSKTEFAEFSVGFAADNECCCFIEFTYYGNSDYAERYDDVFVSEHNPKTFEEAIAILEENYGSYDEVINEQGLKYIWNDTQDGDIHLRNSNGNCDDIIDLTFYAPGWLD